MAVTMALLAGNEFTAMQMNQVLGLATCRRLQATCLHLHTKKDGGQVPRLKKTTMICGWCRGIVYYSRVV